MFSDGEKENNILRTHVVAVAMSHLNRVCDLLLRRRNSTYTHIHILYYIYTYITRTLTTKSFSCLPWRACVFSYCLFATIVLDTSHTYTPNTNYTHTYMSISVVGSSRGEQYPHIRKFTDKHTACLESRIFNSPVAQFINIV